MITFRFIRAQSGARHPFPRDWTLALASTRQFFRNRRGGVLFRVTPDSDEYVPITRAAELRAIIEPGDLVQLIGDVPLSDDDYAGLWFALSDARFRLPLAPCASAPAAPAAPARTVRR